MRKKSISQATKRRRVKDAADRHPSPSLGSLNDDCLLHIFSHSSTKDLNTTALCNRRFCALRAHESLDQTREGIINLREGSTWESLFNAITTNNLNERFQGNMTKLKLTGMERLQPMQSVEEAGMVARQSQLTGVTSLQMTYSPNAGSPRLEASSIQLISLLFPNLVSADLSGLNAFFAGQLCMRFAERCPQLSRFAWNGRGDYNGLRLNGNQFRNAANLTEFYLDNFRFFLSLVSAFSDPSNTFDYILRYCRHLERLSIKNALYRSLYVYGGGAQPVSQDMLIKMVRLHPTLQWIRSDLTAENIAMLQQERPDITFVSD